MAGNLNRNEGQQDADGNRGVSMGFNCLFVQA
jgi:hypothetical protein